jgi:hypothetical protein
MTWMGETLAEIFGILSLVSVEIEVARGNGGCNGHTLSRWHKRIWFTALWYWWLDTWWKYLVRWVARRVVWLLKEVRLNCVTRGERDIDWWGVLLSHIVRKEIELRGVVEWWDLAYSFFPQW